MRFFIFLLLTATLSGCVTLQKYNTTFTPEIAQVNNQQFSATLTPNLNYYGACEAFTLTIVNHTDQDMELDWNKTLYIKNGQTNGGFMYEGILYRDRNNPKSPDFVLAKNSTSKVIWPSSMVTYLSGQYGGWRHEAMATGEHGVMLTLRIDGQELREKLTMNIVTQKTP